MRKYNNNKWCMFVPYIACDNLNTVFTIRLIQRANISLDAMLEKALQIPENTCNDR